MRIYIYSSDFRRIPFKPFVSDWQAGQYLSFAQNSFIAILKQQKVINELVVQNTSSAIESLADASKKCENSAI